MRRPVDAARIRAFMRALGAEADRESRVYLTGGATAVLLGWRESTIDVDLKLEPETDRLLRALSGLKEQLELNVELEPQLHRFPAIDAASFRRAVAAVTRGVAAR